MDLVRWVSGLNQQFAKLSYGFPYRGFESPRFRIDKEVLRKKSLLFCIGGQDDYGLPILLRRVTPPMYFRLFTKRKVEVIIKKVMFSVIITTGLGGIMAYFAHQTIKESPNS